MSYIDSNFNLNYKLISFKELLEAYLSLYIYTKFTSIVNLYSKLYNNTISITRDNASNNNSFISIYKKNINNNIFDIRFITYIINLVV